MPSATTGLLADTHTNPGIHSDTHIEYDPGRDANCDTYSDTDGDTRYPSSGAAHRNPNT